MDEADDLRDWGRSEYGPKAMLEVDVGGKALRAGRPRRRRKLGWTTLKATQQNWQRWGQREKRRRTALRLAAFLSVGLSLFLGRVRRAGHQSCADPPRFLLSLRASCKFQGPRKRRRQLKFLGHDAAGSVCTLLSVDRDAAGEFQLARSRREVVGDIQDAELRRAKKGKLLPAHQRSRSEVI